MTVDVTYRTDFSQVEADQQQVNLTRFNIVFPEKREFFLENTGVFAVGGSGPNGGTGAQNVYPFFSRRIGLSASGAPIPIVGGARLSGMTGPYDLGILTMKTERFDDKPANTFVVGRARRHLSGGSSVGAVVTSRDSPQAGDYNRLYGVDGLWRFFQNRLDVSSYLLLTEAPAATAVIRRAFWRPRGPRTTTASPRVPKPFKLTSTPKSDSCDAGIRRTTPPRLPGPTPTAQRPYPKLRADDGHGGL